MHVSERASKKADKRRPKQAALENAVASLHWLCAAFSTTHTHTLHICVFELALAHTGKQRDARCVCVSQAFSLLCARALQPPPLVASTTLQGNRQWRSARAAPKLSSMCIYGYVLLLLISSTNTSTNHDNNNNNNNTDALTALSSCASARQKSRLWLKRK